MHLTDVKKFIPADIHKLSLQIVLSSIITVRSGA